MLATEESQYHNSGLYDQQFKGYSVKGVSVTDQRSMDVCLERSIHIQAEHLVEAQNSIAGMKSRVLKDPSD